MSMNIVACMATLGFNPVDASLVDEVDLAEINHFYDDQGRLVFDQIIYYDWCPEQGRYNVRDWRLLKTSQQLPVRDWRTGKHVAVWHDPKSRDLRREVRAKSVRESWTQYDPELIEREFLAQDKRRKLRKVPRPKPASSPAAVARRVAEAATRETRYRSAGRTGSR